MKHRHLLITSCLFIFGGATSSFAAYILTNGNFATNDSTGWTTTGSVSATTGAAAISSGGIISQDFSSGTTATTENYDFQLDFSFSLSSVANTHRIRLRSNNYVGGNGTDGDLITLRLKTGSTIIEAFNGGTWFDALTGISVSADTNYWLRVIGTDLDVSGRKYTVGFSTDGTTYTTSSSITAFHASPGEYKDFESIGFESLAGGPTLTVDNISIVPEPSAALLGGLGMLALLRRRR